MVLERSLVKIHIFQQRLQFISSLLTSPKFYRALNNVFSDPSKLDRTLGTLCYLALFVSAILKKYPKFRRKIQEVVVYLERLTAVFYNRTIQRFKLKHGLFEISENDLSPTLKDDEIPPKIANIAATLGDFSSYISDIRIFNRGFSIPGCIADMLEASSLLKCGNVYDFISTWCISLYQPAETIAFLFDHNWLLRGRQGNNCLWWYAVSTRLWFVWVVAELGKVSLAILRKRGRHIPKSQFIEFIEHLATLPLCVHWSLEDGWLSPLSVGFFGTLAGGLTTIDMWKDICRDLGKKDLRNQL